MLLVSEYSLALEHYASGDKQATERATEIYNRVTEFYDKVETIEAKSARLYDISCPMKTPPKNLMDYASCKAYVGKAM
jgi:hypothetical protein